MALFSPLIATVSTLPLTLPYPNLQDTLQDALYSAPPTITISGGTHDTKFSGSEALYFVLSQVPDCRATLDKIDKSLLTNKGTDGNPITITIRHISRRCLSQELLTPGEQPCDMTIILIMPIIFSLIRTGNYLLYRDSAKRTFPVITSAGPDKQFDTADDISNVK